MPTKKPTVSKSSGKKSGSGKNISFLRKNKKALIILTILLFVAAGVASVYKTYAGATYINVCNSSASDNYIKVFNKNHTSVYKWLAKDACWEMYNANNDIRVDLDPARGNIDSYKVGIIGDGYGPCHSAWDVNFVSDPPNASAVRYRNYNSKHCDT